jgi:hypothetical protein
MITRRMLILYAYVRAVLCHPHSCLSAARQSQVFSKSVEHRRNNLPLPLAT